MTDKETFEQQYASCSGMTVTDLRATGISIEPCDCGHPDCDGWQAVSHNHPKRSDNKEEVND